MVDGQYNRKLPLILAAVLLVEAIILLLPGHLAITGHEVDVLHATEAAMRLSMGQMQHVDFMTPLGILAFKPISAFLDFGFDIATANVAANILTGLLFLPLLVWVGARRLGGDLAIWFGILTLIMLTAVVYGGDQATVSMSMYYNRWGWAAAFVIALLILLPELGQASRPRIDGAILGVLLGYLLLLKITFFMVLAPVVALVLIIDRDWQRLAACALAGLGVAILATLVFGGIDFWRHYLADLVFVSGTESRPRPGKQFTEVLSLPKFFPGTICLLAAIVGLRTSGFTRSGLVLFLLAPAFVYITYQNWGNDTKWLLPLSFACFVWSREIGDKKIYGWSGQIYFLVIAFTSLAIIAPSYLNMTTSTLRNLMSADKDYISVLMDERHSGLVIERKRSFAAEAMVVMPDVVDDNPASEDDLPQMLHLGEFEIPQCTLESGYYGLMVQIADDLIAAGLDQKDLAFIDVANPLPLIAPIKRLDYASPWYYGGTRDADGAAYLVVPKCPISQPTFRAYLDALNNGETMWQLSDTREHVWIFTRR